VATRLNPYIMFDGTARQAMEHYRDVLGGDLVVTTFAEGGMPADLGDPTSVMHAQLDTPAGFTLMASDTPSSMPHQPGNNISISLSGEDEADLRRWWDGLAAGGSVQMPLEKAPWGDTFGQLTDRFGILWLVNISGTA
jgi:PhnB protein